MTYKLVSHKAQYESIRSTKGWGHTNKLKQYKHTKYKPRLNKTHSAQTGCMNWSW